MTDVDRVEGRNGEKKGPRRFVKHPVRWFWLGYFAGLLVCLLFLFGFGLEGLIALDVDSPWTDLLPMREDVLLPLASVGLVTFLTTFCALAGGALLYLTLGGGRQEPGWGSRLTRDAAGLLGTSVLYGLPLLPFSAPFVVFVPIAQLALFLQNRSIALRKLSAVYYLAAGLIGLGIHLYGGILSDAEAAVILAGAAGLFCVLRFAPRPGPIAATLFGLAAASVVFPPIPISTLARVAWGAIALLFLALPWCLLGRRSLRVASPFSFALYSLFALYFTRIFLFGSGMADAAQVPGNRYVKAACDGLFPRVDMRFLQEGCTDEEGLVLGTRLRRVGLLGCPPGIRRCPARITAGDNFVADCTRDIGYAPDYMRNEIVALRLSDLSVLERHRFPRSPPPIFVSLGEGGDTVYWLDEGGGFHSFDAEGAKAPRDLGKLSGAAGPLGYRVDEETQTALFADGDVIELLDLKSGTIAKTLDFREPPAWPRARTNSMTFDPPSGTFYVTSYFSEWIYVFDPVRWEIRKAARVGRGIRRGTIDTKRHVFLAVDYARGWLHALSLPDLEERARVFVGKRGRMPYYSARRDRLLLTSSLGAIEVDPKAWDRPRSDD